MPAFYFHHSLPAQSIVSLSSLLPIQPRAMLRTLCASGLIILSLAACSPQYDWRETRGSDAPFVVLLPGKPASFARPVNLDGTTVTMQMTAAEVNGVTFAVGSATMADAGAAQKALLAMKTALVNNIGGTVKRETATAVSATDKTTGMLEVEAIGKRKSDGKPLLLVGRFIARDQRIYQVIVMGQEKSVSREAIDTFLSSFKVD